MTGGLVGVSMAIASGVYTSCGAGTGRTPSQSHLTWPPIARAHPAGGFAGDTQLVRILTQSLKIITIIVVAVVAVGGAVWFFDYWQHRDPSDAGRPVVLEVTSEDDSGTVAEKLKDGDLLRFPLYFETRLRFEDVDLRPGVYTLRKGMSTMEIIEAITVDAVATGDESPEAGGDAQVIEVTLVEGQRAEQFGEEIEKAGYPNGTQVFMDALKNPDVRKGWDFLEDVPADASLEGFLFPDTYTFTTDYTGEDMVSVMLENFNAKVSEQTRESFRDQGLSIYEAITVASIVEREAAVAEERPVIAAVYLNRLAQDPQMLLNADPTIQYAVGGPGNWWPAPLTTEQLEVDSPYNTYIHTGLPPGPISNPGIASIQAVGKPADVDYLYFVAKNDDTGEHVFATTYEEHQANVCTYDPEGCEGASIPAPQYHQVAYIDDRWRAA